MSLSECLIEKDQKFVRWLNNLKPEDRGLFWLIFAVGGVILIFLFLLTISNAAHNQPYYDAVLIFFGGTFGCALWDTFKWAFLDVPDDDKDKFHRPKTEIIEHQQNETLDVTPSITSSPKLESNTETETTINNAILYLTQVVAAAAIITIVIQIISLSQINTVYFNLISFKVLFGSLFFVAFLVLLMIFYHERFGRWP